MASGATSEAREALAAALAVLDTASTEIRDNLRGALPWNDLPDGAVTEEVVRAVYGGQLPPAFLVSRGRIREASAGLTDRSVQPWTRVYQVAQLELLGIAVPAELTEAPGRRTSVPPSPSRTPPPTSRTRWKPGKP